MRKMLMLLLVLAVLLCGCAVREEVPQTQPSQLETEAVTELVTEPITEPVTEPVTEAETEPVTEPEVIAQPITDGFRVIIDNIRQNTLLCDGSHYTKAKITSGSVLRIESDQPVSSLYLTWEQAPGTYRITWDGGSVQAGENGFIHEFVALPESVTAAEFVFDSQEAVRLCDVSAYTEGTPPAGVQVWQPPCEKADILLFPTHSDDDVLFFGALISQYAIERELTVQTAFMVEHTGYSQRNHERLNGLWEMGVRHYPILGSAPDTPTTSFYYASITYEKSHIDAWQVEQIRRFQPLVVVGHDLNGEYGNGGHKVNARFLTQSILAAADPQQYPESAALYGVWETPKLYLHLYDENQIILDVNTPLQNDPLGRTPFEIAQDAYAYHVSQHQYYFKVTQDEKDTKHNCRVFGLYHTLVGPDTEADIMQNIDPALWREN